MATIFTKIIDGEIPGEIVYRDDVCVVLLDIQPLTPGHAMVIPIQEIDHWLDLEASTTAHLMQVAARIGRAQQQVFGGERVGLIIQGFEVPHAHIHVFATSDPSDFDLTARSSRSSQELASDAEALRAALASS